MMIVRQQSSLVHGLTMLRQERQAKCLLEMVIPLTILAGGWGPPDELTGSYYGIKEDKDPVTNDTTYKVRYVIESPKKDVLLSSMYETIPQVEKQLKDFLHEIGGRDVITVAKSF